MGFSRARNTVSSVFLSMVMLWMENSTSSWQNSAPTRFQGSSGSARIVIVIGHSTCARGIIFLCAILFMGRGGSGRALSILGIIKYRNTRSKLGGLVNKFEFTQIWFHPVIRYSRSLVSTITLEVNIHPPATILVKIKANQDSEFVSWRR